MNDNIKVLELDIIKQQIASYSTFSLGRLHVEALVPSFDRLVVERELQRVKETLALVIKYGSLPFIGLSDINTILQKVVKDGICQPNELLEVASHAYCCDELVKFIKSAEGNYEEIDDLIHSLSYSLALSKEIERCITVNGEVADNASTKLKSLRKQLQGCEADLHNAVDCYIKTHSSHLSDSISTQRNDRFVVLVKSTDRNMIKGFIHGESASGQTVYMEPESLLHLNNQRLSLNNQISDEIMKILFDLSQMVKKQADAYRANLITLAILDSYNAKALWAKYHDATVAKIDEQLLINKARHPLIDPKQVVANTYQIIPPITTLLITGPNTGGKTVSLKTIGLFVLMTYCGMPISCEEAIIPMFDEVFVDMGDNQSIVESLSTFSAHLKKLAYICDKASSKSLILLDELGGGTDPLEGECLAIAVLDYLRQLDAMIVATTHYNRLKTYGKKHPDILLASVQFDVERLRPTYKYIEGLIGQSNAIDIADKFGLNAQIINNARKLKDTERTQEDILIEELEKTIMINRQKEEELNLIIDDQAQVKVKLEKELDYYQNNKEKLLDQAKTEADKYLDQTKEEADELLKQMRVVSESGQLHEGIAVKYDIDKLRQDDDLYDQENVRDFVVGDYVLIKNTNQRGSIESIDRKKAIINANGLKINVALLDLKLSKEKPKKKERITHKVSHVENLSFELNLIGMRVDEALPVLDKYLDDCVLMKAPYIRIIHGFGTGALRKAIWAHLKHNRFIEEMHLGGQQEGGSGATIITLKRKK